MNGKEKLVLKLLMDDRLKSVHLALFLALIEKIGFDSHRKCTISSRRELMLRAKVKSKSTYHKCISELVCFEYLNYQASYNPSQSSFFELRLTP